MIKTKISVSLDTILDLPREIVTYCCGEDVVVVSPKDGNWLVLSEAQYRLYEQLSLGRCIGDILSTDVDPNVSMSLLKQIFARNFREKSLSVTDTTTKALFYLTYDCNLQCEHCYMYAQKMKAPLLSIDEYEMVFQGLYQNGVTDVTFSGGEPLVRFDFWEIIKRARKIGLVPKVFSNGTLWAETDIKNAKDLAIKAQISIDGVDEKSCAVVRGTNVFAKAKDVVVQLAEAGVDVEVATTPTPANIEAVECGYADFVEELREKLGQRVKFKVSLDLMPGRNVPIMNSIEKQEYTQRGSRLYSIANPDGVKIPFFDEYRRGIGRTVCGLGRLVFSPDGFVHVCSQLDFLSSIGNVRDVGISGLIERAHEYVAAASVDNTIPCRECSLRHICGGGCRAERYEYVSRTTERPSVHKPCSERQKMALVKMMVQATKECYRWE